MNIERVLHRSLLLGLAPALFLACGAPSSSKTDTADTSESTACAGEPTKVAAKPAPSKPSSPAEARLEEARAMALAKPTGGEKIDARIHELEESARHNPDKADTWVLLGRAWVQKARQSADPGYYLHADACAELALSLKPDYPLALSLRGLVLMNDHRFTEARTLAEKILAADPDDIMTLGVLSDAELELGNYDRAAIAAQKMVDLKPSLPSYSRAAYLRWLAGDTKEAKRIMWLAIDAGRDQRDPEPGAWVLVEAAKIFFHEGDYLGAQAGVDRALTRVPEYPAALLLSARIQHALGQPKKAAELAKRAFDTSHLAEAAWVWGDAERAAGELDRAKEAYAQVVAIGRQGDRRTLAAFYATEDRDLDEAAKLIDAELQHRGDVYTHDAHAWVLYRQGKLAEAKAASDRALAHGTKDALLLYHSGAIRLALGDTKEGTKRIAAALRTNPKFQPTGAKEAERLLARQGLARR